MVEFLLKMCCLAISALCQGSYARPAQGVEDAASAGVEGVLDGPLH
ncbi:hypothetical protein KQ303_12145 [Synechococcus sp. CS-1333]|nr:hypothetical protein [Synechococcus sp. CS-1333]MCT0211420.1 hypothetical protein [Synechococcus sp. CS-1333]